MPPSLRARVTASLILCGLPLATACSKPKAFAPTDDFVRRHHCPRDHVETTKEGSDRARVTGCGEAELYVQECANRSAAAAVGMDREEPITEGEARHGDRYPSPLLGESGCAWTRKPDHAVTAPVGE